jgi:hypothetical protein
MARPEARVQTAAIVVSDPLPKHAPYMALIQRNHEIQTLTANRARCGRPCVAALGF